MRISWHVCSLLLTDVFENFRNMCLEIYELDTVRFWLTWQVALKKAKVRLDLLTDIDMSLMIEKRYQRMNIWRYYRHAKSNNKSMKYFIKNKESSYLKYWDVNDMHGWAMSQKIPVNDFKCVEDISEFDKFFIKSHNEKSDERYFLETDIQYHENSPNLRNDQPFSPEIA